MEEYTTIPVIHSLDELIQQLHEIFECDRVNVDHVKAVLSAYKSNPKDWKKFAKFDLHRYTRNLIDCGNGKFNLMALCWGESHGSSIHDHADSHCFVKILDGQLQESMYEWPTDSESQTKMTPKEINLYDKDGVTYINDSMGLHRMENPSHIDGCISMHLYSPPFSECKTFDERTGHERTCTVTFWSKFGERTPFTTNECAGRPSSSPVSMCCNDN